MGASIVDETAARILHSRPPTKLLRLAEAFVLQSSTAIPLKPNLEAARVYICCVLAIERMGPKLQLLPHDTAKPPVPPQAYARLLDQFRQTLTGNENPQPRVADVSGQEAGRTQRKAHQKARKFWSARSDDEDDAEKGSPALSRTSRSTAAHNGNPGKLDGSDLENRTHGLHVSRRDDKDDTMETSPQKTSPRKRAKRAAPTRVIVEQIGNDMGLTVQTTDAVRDAFTQYVDLVKDPWGLVYGLFAVVSERAEPKMGKENLIRLDSALQKFGPPRLLVNVDEWVPWVERIVTGQTWIMQISKRPEPTPRLVGASGGWGLGVEYTLVDL